METDERALKASMDPQLSAAVASKRILVFEETLKDADYEDLGVVDELRLGAQLIGDVEITGMLPPRFVLAMLSEKMLGQQAKLGRAKFEVRGQGSQDHEIDVSIWEQTLQEVEDGWLVGPLALRDVPMSSPPFRGVLDKIRCIDDECERCSHSE